MTHSLPSARKYLCILAFFLYLVAPLALHPQATGAKLEGTIVDSQGMGVNDATVTVANATTHATQNTHTDSSGNYAIEGLPAGTYTVDATGSGFGKVSKSGITLVAGQTQRVGFNLSISALVEQVTVNAGVDSVAAETAPSGGFIEERSAQSLISNTYIENFTSPIADFGEIVQIVPGAFSISTDGVGLGQSKTYFRGFPDGDYDIDFDGIPFYDTNSPTHHSWAFFPAQWVGGVDFDRSPGSAATIGPTPFGGSIHLLSKPLTSEFDIRGTALYGTWNTKLFDGAFNSGAFRLFGGPPKSNLFIDWHRMTSDGYQTFNFNMRNAGSLLYQYQFSPKTVLTGFAGVIRLNANTYGLNPTRCQTLGLPAGATYTCTGVNSAFIGAGINFMMTNNADPVNWLDYQYNSYQVPTDFEYVGVKSELGHGWYVDVKPYTYNYDNAELFSNATPITESSTVNGSKVYNGVTIAPCDLQVVKKGIAALPCAVDKYNSYRKYGETSVLSQTSQLGVFRTGLWYEWAKTNRHQYPSDPLNHWQDQPLGNFDETFYTNSYQPYAEYEFHVTNQLNITAGTKYSAYTFDIIHKADDGKTVGSLCPIGQVTGCPATATDTGTFKAWLPSLDFNFRIHPNWSIYAQGATGSIVPPSNVYDFNHTPTAAVPHPGLQTPPKQQRSTTYQVGSVFKGKRMTLDGDLYRVRFQNSYSGVIDPTTTETVYYLQPSSVTQGVEFEANFVVASGLSLYLNGTAANAYYQGRLNANPSLTSAPFYVSAPSGLWVAQTPADTEQQGVTYQLRGFDLGFFNKRVGEQRVDGGAYHNQGIVPAFSNVNTYVNYTVRNHSLFDQTKVRFTANNLFDQHNLTGLTLAGSQLTQTIPGSTCGTSACTDPFTTTGPTPINGSDNPTFLAGRSFSISVTFGFAPKEK